MLLFQFFSLAVRGKSIIYRVNYLYFTIFAALSAYQKALSEPAILRPGLSGQILILSDASYPDG